MTREQMAVAVAVLAAAAAATATAALRGTVMCFLAVAVVV
jgi:hypothetical protein